MDLYQQYIHKSRYARYLPEEKRREHWEETVHRYISYLKKTVNVSSEALKHLDSIEQAIVKMEVMPSMRAMMVAGPALDKDNTACYNCAYVAVDDPKAFDEAMVILMNGTGIGFSVERQYIQKLPEIPDKIFPCDTIIRVKDSKEGWGKALRMLIALLYSGECPQWDVSLLRPAGAILKTFGGRSSGPGPLEDLFKFVVKTFQNARGRKLTSIECHDIMCKIGEAVVVGGVRRCLPVSTNVHTTKGIKKLQDVQLGDLVFTGKGYDKVVAKENTGKKQLWKIQTQLGDYYSSAEHRWAVLSNLEGDIRWVETKDLTLEDVMVSYAPIAQGSKTELPNFNYTSPEKSTMCKDITIPRLSNEVSWFLGQLHGDGYVYLKPTRGYVSVACSDDLPEQYQRVCETLKQFGVNTYSPLSTERCSKPRANSKQLAAYLSQFKKPRTTMDIPVCIREGLIEIRASYIAGLFDADGHLPQNTTQKAPIVVSTIYPKFAEQIRDLLASVGIYSVVRLVRKSTDRWQSIYNVQIFGKESLDMWNKIVAPHSCKHRKFGINSIKHEQRSFVVPFQEKVQSFISWNEQQAASIENYEGVTWRPVKILSVEATDIFEETADIEVQNKHCFVVGGGLLTHNSAMISLSNLSDDRMRHAKFGAWWEQYPYRALANNSAVYNEKPDVGIFMEEWLSLYNSKSGERGLFSREAARKIANNGRRDPDYEFGTNPCSEIILRPNQFCNLTEVIARSDDTLETLEQKVKMATILGTFQATFTYFPYLRKIWKKNTEEERLLGVSITGIYDCPLLNDHNDPGLPSTLQALKQVAIQTNKEFAKMLGINQSVAVTCVKPSGTVSQLVDAASGIHPRFAKYYYRRVRSDNKDPITKFMIDRGTINEQSLNPSENASIFTFVKKAPEGAFIRDDITALDHLKLWLVYQKYWCEHKPSVTINVKEHEWFSVGAWVYENFEWVSGISFLPYDGGTYRQAPYEEIDSQNYLETVEDADIILDWNQLKEEQDNVEGVQTLACTAGGCEV